QRVASHLRAHGHGHAVTIAEHRPRSHQAHLEWTPSRMVHWAQTIGPHTARLFERILADKPHPEMGYRSCLGIIRLADQYSRARVEAAAERALLTGACRYQSIKSILKNSLDVIPPSTPPPSSPPPPHDNIRGAVKLLNLKHMTGSLAMGLALGSTQVTPTLLGQSQNQDPNAQQDQE